MTEPPEVPDPGQDSDNAAELEQRLEEIGAASERMGHKDWLSLIYGAAATLALSGAVRTSNLTVFAYAGGVLVAVAIIRFVRSPLRRSPAPPDPDARMRGRVDEISKTLAVSAKSLGLAASLISDLQKEVSSRAEALAKLQQETADHEERARLSQAASKAIDDLVEARIQRSERRMRKMGWVWASVGVGAGVVLVVFGHFVPIIK